MSRGGGGQPTFRQMAVLGIALFVLGNWERSPGGLPRDQLAVAMPVPVQILLAAGDRFAAANVGVWRAIMVSPGDLQRDTVPVLAAIQEAASWLNPAHEDNYYTATAILPWEGEVEKTQIILQRATEARPRDILPPFFLGFNRLHFLGDPQGASEAAQTAAQHAEDAADRQALLVLAARWAERVDDMQASIRLIRQMAETSRDPALQNYLQQRVKRLEGLLVLREATARFEAKHKRKVVDLNELVAAGVLERIPDDPLGGGYRLENHWPVLGVAPQ